MTHQPRDQRIPFMMSAMELQRLDDWRFAHRIATRAEAIRQLIVRGIESELVAPRSIRVSAAPQEDGPDLAAFPTDLLTAADAYAANFPWITGRQDAFIALVRCGLEEFEGREDRIELPSDILQGLKELSATGDVERTALSMLREAIQAWELRRELALDGQSQ